MIEPILNHIERMLGDLLSQFRNSSRLRALVEIIGAEIQWIEDVLQHLRYERTLDGATGVQLDHAGEIVGQKRNGLSDALYQKLIRVRIPANRSRGHVDEITWILDQLVEPIHSVLYRPLYPAGFQLEYHVPEPTDSVLRTIIHSIINSVLPSGVALTHIAETVGSDGYFGFAEDPHALGFDEGSFETDTI